MSFQFLNPDRSAKNIVGKTYSRPQDILNDIYLSPMQKCMVLEAMLMEARDEALDGKTSKKIEDILKIKAGLQGNMD